MHHFDEALELTAVGDPAEGRWQGRTSPRYANMVGPYGGLTVATMLQAVLRHPECLGEPLALTVNFAGPVGDGGFEILARPARTNRSTQHWTVELRQEGATATTATAMTGVRRPTWESTEAVRPAAPPAGSVPPMGEALPLEWLHRYDLRYVRGPVPGQGGAEPNQDSVSWVWARHDPPRPLDYLGLAAYSDVFFPRVFLRTGRWMPAGTVSITVYFHADAAALAAHGDLAVLAVARAERFTDGYFDQSAQVWGADTLLATSHQLVYYKG
jgi:hypothetical protein